MAEGSSVEGKPSEWNPKYRKELAAILDKKYGKPPPDPRRKPSEVIQDTKDQIGKWAIDHLPRLDKLPVLGEKAAKALIRGQVKRTRKSTGTYFLFYQEEDKPAVLFRGQTAIGRLPKDKAEEYVCNVLPAFNVDLNKLPEHTYPPFESRGINQGKDGSTVEVVTFPGYETVSFLRKDLLTKEEVPASYSYALNFTKHQYKGGNPKNERYYWTVEGEHRDA